MQRRSACIVKLGRRHRPGVCARVNPFFGGADKALRLVDWRLWGRGVRS
jgi:hypothetical protein